MGIPSCLWRRTGEIYKGNKEFAALGACTQPILSTTGRKVELTHCPLLGKTSGRSNRAFARGQTGDLRADGRRERSQLLGEIRQREFEIALVVALNLCTVAEPVLFSPTCPSFDQCLTLCPPLFPRLSIRQIAFDAGQKAVLTSCVLVNQSVLSKKRKKPGQDKQKRLESAMINVSTLSFDRIVAVAVGPHSLQIETEC